MAGEDNGRRQWAGAGSVSASLAAGPSGPAVRLAYTLLLSSFCPSRAAQGWGSVLGRVLVGVQKVMRKSLGRQRMLVCRREGSSPRQQ